MSFLPFSLLIRYINKHNIVRHYRRGTLVGYSRYMKDSISTKIQEKLQEIKRRRYGGTKW